MALAAASCTVGSVASYQEASPPEAAATNVVAETVTVFTLDPHAPSEEEVDSSQSLFGGYLILGSVQVTDRDLITEVLGDLQKGFEAEGITPMRCFIPRHGVRHTTVDGIAEYVICFQCNLYRSSGAGTTRGGTTSSVAKGVLNRILRNAGLLAATHAEDQTAATLIVLKVDKGGQDLKTTTADLLYQKTDALLGRTETRHGRMVVTRDPSGVASSKLAIQFDDRIINGRRKQELQHYVFDGRWLFEINESTHQIIERELVAEGEISDPFRLDGPIPLPIGQSFREVLKRFQVSLVQLPGDGILKTVAEVEGVVGIQLVPKKGSPDAQRYASIDLFYDPATWLPVGVVAVGTNGDRKVLRLTNITRNEALSEGAVAMMSVTAPEGQGWKVDRQPLPIAPAPPPSP